MNEKIENEVKELSKEEMENVQGGVYTDIEWVRPPRPTAYRVCELGLDIIP